MTSSQPCESTGQPPSWDLDPRQLAPESVLEATTGFYRCKCMCAQSCPTICDPMDCSLPGSSVHGISQARTMEQVTISFSRGASAPRNRTLLSCIGKAHRLYSRVLFCRGTSSLLASAIYSGDFFTFLFFFQIYPNIQCRIMVMLKSLWTQETSTGPPPPRG